VGGLTCHNEDAYDGVTYCSDGGECRGRGAHSYVATTIEAILPKPISCYVSRPAAMFVVQPPRLESSLWQNFVRIEVGSTTCGKGVGGGWGGV
jgi:hypothetical protein